MDAGKIPTAILGAWEIESIALDGRLARVDRPDPGNPYQKLNSSEFTQIYFTADQIQWIHTDFVFVKQMKSPYRVEGRKVVTIDRPDSSFVDLIVYTLSDDTLTIGFNSSEEEAPRMRWTFRRINEDALASRTAREVSYQSQFQSRIERKGQLDLSLARVGVGRIDFFRDGVYDSVLCFLNKDRNLEFHFSVLEVKDDSVRSTSDTDFLHLTFKGLHLDLSGPSQAITMPSPIQFSAHSGRNWFFDELSGCENKILRQGAEVVVDVICTDPMGAIKASFAGSCLLRQSLY